jgi:hypothetical protein
MIKATLRRRDDDFTTSRDRLITAVLYRVIRARP